MWALGVIWLQPERLTVLGDRLIDLAMMVQGIAEVGVGHSVARIEPQRLA